MSNHSTSSLSAPVLSLAGRGCSHEELQSLEPIIETQTTEGECSDDEQTLTPTTNEESPIFGRYRTEESPIFPPRARDNPEVIPNQDKTEPISVTESRNAPNFTKRQRIAWPRTHDRKWDVFDEDIDVILQSTLQGRVERKINTLTTKVYSMGLERFGCEGKDRKQKHEPIPNRRERERKKLREELNSLRKRFKKASMEEKRGLAEIREQLRSRLKTLTTAERLRRKRRERTRKRAAFIANPYRFTKTLLGEERGGSLQSSEEEVVKYLREVHSDPNREHPLGDCDRISAVDPPKFSLNMKEPSLQEVRDVVKKARACSAPGPSGIPYKVYKKCLKLLRRLWLLLRTVWKSGTVPDCWQAAEGCFVPKEKHSEDIKQFRTISLLSVEGKIFFSILARRLTTYMTDNTYINSSVQKGGIPGFSGCVDLWMVPYQELHLNLKVQHCPTSPPLPTTNLCGLMLKVRNKKVLVKSVEFS